MSLPEEVEDTEAALGRFVAEQVLPHAARIDREECVPEEILTRLASAGYLASGLPEEFGGPSAREPVAAMIRHGLMHEALGGASASVQGVVNVHHMAGRAIARWGTAAQKARWLPAMATGSLLGAVAITEPAVGSDAASVETSATADEQGFALRGEKRWITCGQRADLFVLLARGERGPAAFLLPRATPGLSIRPTHGLLGCRGYMLAELHLDGCRLPREHLLGQEGFGFSHVAAASLDAGRHNLAWGCVGLARACLDASLRYARTRRQSGRLLAELPLVQQMLSRMMTEIEAARLMCLQNARMLGLRDPGAIKQGCMAKYFASLMVNRVAHDAAQIHGACGVSSGYPLERYLRDARIMEIIEGTTQILEVTIARYGDLEPAWLPAVSST